MAGPPVYGDVNCDGGVNSIDAALVLQLDAAIIDDLPCLQNADVYPDGHVTSVDAALILEHHAGLLPLLPPDALANIPTSGCPSSPKLSDGTVIANHLLMRHSDQLLLNRAERDSLASEIDAVLSLIRAAYPELIEIRARPTYGHSVSVGPSPPLIEAIRRIVDEEAASVTFITGDSAFDILNARLSLGGVYVLRFSGSVILCFPDNLNPPAAAEAFEMLAGVLWARPDKLAGDGPDIEVVQQNDTWYVIFRDAWGDCPAGCTEGELFFFTVSDDEVTAVREDDATSDPAFQEVLQLLFPWRPLPPP